MKTPKVALFYDWLNQWGGAERVLLDILKIYPTAPVYTLVHNPTKTKWLPQKTNIITSFINSLPNAVNNPIYYTPLYPIALEQFNFSKFDIVISTTTTIGHCLLTSTQTLYLCYFHNINRYLYQKNIIPKIYQKIDQIYSHRPDHFLVSSKNVRQRIQKHYHRPATLIYPGVNLNNFKPNQKQPKKYFLVVSRLVAHKKTQIAIQACHQLNLPLVVVGTGRQLKKLKKLKQEITADTVTFTGSISQKKLINLYQNCQALICPQLEDFGLTPIEAQACGRPVIAFNKGGHRETIINAKTGILFPQQTVTCLAKTLKNFQIKNYHPQDCIKQAQHFSQKLFMLNFKKTVNYLWHQNTI